MVRAPGTFETNEREMQVLRPSDNQVAKAVDLGDTPSTPIYTMFPDSARNDAFQRLRVSNPETIFDSKQIFDKAPLFWDDQEVSGSGTISLHSQLTASTIITVANLTAGKRVRQTFMRFNYQPGKSQLILMTGTLSTPGAAGIKRAMGMFDDDNGIFVRDNEGVVEMVIRSNYTGTPVENAVAQANWNIDKLDGTGPSGYTLDDSKSQIFVIDFEWLGVGRVRTGFVIDGQIIYTHEFKHSNRTAGVYMSTPNLPLRYEVENDGTGPAGSLEHICSSVMSEGGSQATGILRHADSNDLTGLSSGTSYGFIGLRLKSGALGSTTNIVNMSMLASTKDDKAHWFITFNPEVAGTVTWVDIPNSTLQIALGTDANTITAGGDEIDGGFFTTDIPAITSVPNARRLGSAIDGTPDTIWLCAKPLTANMGISASITWRELS